LKAQRLWGGALLVLVLIYFFISPPLFNYDGYLYRLQGLAPLSDINHTHLLWVPIQWLIWQLGYALHQTSPRFFQAVSTVVLLFLYVTCYRLWSAFSRDNVVGFLLTVFAASTPFVWYLSSQNEPYPFMFLCLMICTASWASATPEQPPWMLSTFMLAIATLLHQAAFLLCIGFSVFVFCYVQGSAGRRFRHAALWFLSATGLIALVYGLVGWMKGLRSLADYSAWLTGYLHSQHALQRHWYENVAKSLIGLTNMVLPFQLEQERLYAHFTDGQIRSGLLFFAAAIAVIFLAVLLNANRRGWLRQFPGIREPALGVSVAFVGAWSVFAICWEPVNYYWAVILFPLLTLLARALRDRPVIRRAAVLILLAGIALNLYGDRVTDRINAQRFIDPQLAMIHAAIPKNTGLLFLKRSWYADVDYDLIGRVLKSEGYRVSYLLDDYVLPYGIHWTSHLRQDLEQLKAKHRRLYMSQVILNPEAYKDLANTYFLSTYIMEKYAGISGALLYPQARTFFQAQKTIATPLQVGQDTWIEVSPGSGK